MVKSKQGYAPLFENPPSIESPSPKRATKKQRTPESSQKRIAVALPTEEPAQPSTSFFSRVGSSLWGAFGSTAPAPLPLHPALAKINHLPKVEPWTKTHYKTLDKLYQKHIRNPSLLSPHHSSPSSSLNTSLRDDFLDKTGLPFVGATFSVWRYSIQFDDGLVVLCAAYMQLLSLTDIAEYEAKSGKAIQMGDCGPRKAGIVIEGEEVAKRLATVIIGEELRRDEKRGRKIHREGSLQIEWPKT
ncbi:unnamed protein product [Periconia digitata]|uniref:Uncharacterized protein n=1 Tax=Periconia digitata TaxID=1303443 RepID=A0A9W4U7H2_9PLEO|nr:unnamed protein product [Periconia digitata]